MKKLILLVLLALNSNFAFSNDDWRRIYTPHPYGTIFFINHKGLGMPSGKDTATVWIKSIGVTNTFSFEKTVLREIYCPEEFIRTGIINSVKSRTLQGTTQYSNRLPSYESTGSWEYILPNTVLESIANRTCLAYGFRKSGWSESKIRKYFDRFPK